MDGYVGPISECDASIDNSRMTIVCEVAEL